MYLSLCQPPLPMASLLDPKHIIGPQLFSLIPINTLRRGYDDPTALLASRCSTDVLIQQSEHSIRHGVILFLEIWLTTFPEDFYYDEEKQDDEDEEKIELDEHSVKSLSTSHGGVIDDLACLIYLIYDWNLSCPSSSPFTSPSTSTATSSSISSLLVPSSSLFPHLSSLMTTVRTQYASLFEPASPLSGLLFLSFSPRAVGSLEMTKQVEVGNYGIEHLPKNPECQIDHLTCSSSSNAYNNKTHRRAFIEQLDKFIMKMYRKTISTYGLLAATLSVAELTVFPYL